MEDHAVIAQTSPFYRELKKGRAYFWCTCGRSQKQPFCDGSHKGTTFEPQKFVAEEDGQEVLFCGCKLTKTGPFCDGSHNNIEGAYKLDNPESALNKAIPIAQREGAFTNLDGGCFVFSPEFADLKTVGTLSCCTVVDGAVAAHYQSQFYLRLKKGQSPIITFGDDDAVVFVASGEGTAAIDDQQYALSPGTSLLVVAGEALQFDAAPVEGCVIFVSVCSASASIGFAANALGNSAAAHKVADVDRCVRVDQDLRQAMGERYFQMLVVKPGGGIPAAQFIGEIPTSKAVPHKHLYEETLIVLSGTGFMWTDTKKAAVKGGDVIFLPRKQIHSLECSGPESLYVVGVIMPGDNPTINYY